MMIEINSSADRVVLVAAPRRGSSADNRVQQSLDELERLADTAGAHVVERLVQRVTQVKPSTYLGTGKLQELAETITCLNVDVVVFDDELSPGQGKNIERALKVRVMDRAELILDIFAMRARTSEARLQVELAQLEYLLPRLARMWVHLSRIRGGIGLRGPGETQLETDRRMIRRKISQLKTRLSRAERHRSVVRAGRRPILTAALVGYTNAGKSSLLRAVTGAECLIEDRFFATLDTLTREMFIAPNTRVRLIDTVGFIRKLPHDLVASFRATLEEVAGADVLLHVVDASDPDWMDHCATVEDAMAELSGTDQPTIVVCNKMDAVEDPEGIAMMVRSRFPEVVLVSAARGDVAELRIALAQQVAAYRAARHRSAVPKP